MLIHPQVVGQVHPFLTLAAICKDVPFRLQVHFSHHGHSNQQDSFNYYYHRILNAHFADLTSIVFAQVSFICNANGIWKVF